MSMFPPELVKVDALIGAGMVNVLGIKGTKQQPQNVDMGGISVVFDVAAGGYAGAEFVNAKDAATFSIAGGAGTTRQVLGPVGFDPNLIINTNSQNCRVLGLTTFFTFDAAGIAAFAGKTIGFQLGMTDPRNTASGEIPIHEEKAVIVAGGLTQRISANPALWNGLIPNPFALAVTLLSYDGTVFPANTTGRVHLSVARAALHQQLPS